MNLKRLKKTVETMNLERLAEGIIDYLDSVGVAAEYQIHHKFLTIITDRRNFIMMPGQCFHEFINEIESYYPKEDGNHES